MIPEITVEDKLTLKELEAAALNAQLRAGQAQAAVSAANQLLNNYAEELFKRYKLKPDEFILDLKGMKFVSREK